MMQKDDAWDTVNELGKLNAIHFIDLNKDKAPHEQIYSNTIKNVCEVEKKIE